MTNSEEKSLPKKIAEDIIAFILEENLQPGDKLPNETVPVSYTHLTLPTKA